MPQLQDLVLTDRKATPLNHTFTNGSITNGVAMLEEYTGVPIGSPKVSISLRKTAGKIKGRLVLAVPVVQDNVVSGVANPTVIRTAIADLQVTFDQKSSEAERNDLMGMLASSLQTTKIMVHDSFVKTQNIN